MAQRKAASLRVPEAAMTPEQLARYKAEYEALRPKPPQPARVDHKRRLRQGERALSPLAAKALEVMLRGENSIYDASAELHYGRNTARMALIRACPRFGVPSLAALIVVLYREGFIADDFTVKERV